MQLLHLLPLLSRLLPQALRGRTYTLLRTCTSPVRGTGTEVSKTSSSGRVDNEDNEDKRVPVANWQIYVVCDFRRL